MEDGREKEINSMHGKWERDGEGCVLERDWKEMANGVCEEKDEQCRDDDFVI